MPPKKQPAAKPTAHELSPERAEALAAALRPYDDPLAKAVLADMEGEPGTERALGDRLRPFWERNGDRIIDLLVRLLDRTTARDGG
jgi:hypothetical protein